VVIVDTGVLYALADRRDAHHAACLRWLISARPPEAAFLDELKPGGSFALAELLPADLARMAVLVRRYAGLRLGGTDASVVALAERLGVDQVATVDRRHFSVVPPAHVDALTLLPVEL
jgi:predicted nucleic acid-binding protein